MNAKIVLICLMAVSSSYAYSSGAPPGACFDMVPKHLVDPQSSSPPYRIQVSKNQLRSGDTVDVTIQGLKEKDKIKGFMIQARVGKTPVGKWFVNKSNAYGQTLKCGKGVDNTVTHRKIEGDGPKSLTFNWQSPPSLAESVKFRATITLNGGVFWVGVLSPTVSVY